MLQFVAFAWDGMDAESGALAQSSRSQLVGRQSGWRTAFEGAGLIVLFTGPEAKLSLAPEHGVVLGTVFRAEHSTALASFSPSEALEIQQSRGKRLVDAYWGRYIAFLVDSDREDLRVLRDPIGAIACHVARHRRLHVFFSSAGEVIQLGLMSGEINWRFVAAHMHCPRALRSRETALNGVSEILPGECWRFRNSTSVHMERYWSPARIARHDPILDAYTAIRGIRDATRLCVSAWSSCYSDIVHLLSGGLDSSIVLRCIGERPHVTALTYFNSFSTFSDERNAARLAAETTKCRLVEIDEDPAGSNLEAVLALPANPRPWEIQYFLTHSSLEKAVTDEVKATAVFSGNGGDHIYFQGDVAFAATDYAAAHLPDRYLIRLCANIAFRQRLSFWSLFASSLRDGWGLRRWSPERHIRKLLLNSPEVGGLARSSGLLEPHWLEDAEGLSYGKLEHIRSCCVRPDSINPFSTGTETDPAPDRVSPLISQPLIEQCLRTPLYLLGHAGIDRFVARQAFSDVLPPQIVSRHAKGTADAFLQRLLTGHNLRFAREQLMDGALVTQGLLDRRKLELALDSPAGRLNPERAEVVVFHLATEAWVQWAQRLRTSTTDLSETACGTQSEKTTRPCLR